jgi:hypothetical protein
LRQSLFFEPAAPGSGFARPEDKFRAASTLFFGEGLDAVFAVSPPVERVHKLGRPARREGETEALL